MMETTDTKNTTTTDSFAVNDATKQERKRLKHLFQRQHQRFVLERRLRQSWERGDVELAEQTKKDLQQHCTGFSSMEQREVELLQQERKFLKELEGQHLQYIVKIYHTLHLDDYSNPDARKLLFHMSQATTERELFKQNSALKGYAKQKFISRARLIATSIAKVRCYFAATKHISTTTKTMENSLNNVQAIVSVGCGPGCDLTGAMAGLQDDDAIQHIIALDYAMDEWAFLVQKVLSAINVPQYDMMTCDIRQPAQQNDDVMEKITSLAPSLLVTVSYVLCETRNQWHAWMDQLVNGCGIGTLWLLTEPTAWQLHIFRKRYRDQMDFMWLDTSMYREDLQELENRNGPAVLLCRKNQPA